MSVDDSMIVTDTDAEIAEESAAPDPSSKNENI
jgi:hypothetical protein